MSYFLLQTRLKPLNTKTLNKKSLKEKNKSFSNPQNACLLPRYLSGSQLLPVGRQYRSQARFPHSANRPKPNGKLLRLSCSAKITQQNEKLCCCFCPFPRTSRMPKILAKANIAFQATSFTLNKALPFFLQNIVLFYFLDYCLLVIA